MAAYQVCMLVEKMASPDKDFRFMAINDLMREMTQGNISLEEDSSAKVIRALVRLLNDSNGEVQNLAIKCIGTLAQPSRIKQHHLEFVIEELTPMLFSKVEASRDVHAMTIKAIIQNLAPVSSNVSSGCVVRKLLPKLTEALRSRPLDDSAKIDVIDIIGDLLFRFGDIIPELHDPIHDVILTQLTCSRQAIRKKATIALGNLAAVVNTQLYDRIVAGLLDKLGNAKGAESCRTFIVAITFVAKSSGTKFSDHLSKVVPYLIQFLRSSDDDDLKEAALQGLEVFLYRCPTEVAAFQTDVQQVLTSNISYDPNYEYGEQEEEEEMEYEDDDEDYSDDEDMTWKVRRATAKAIEAMINSRRESLLLYITNLGPLLISRFKEREETVRNEVLSAYVALLNQFSIVIPSASIKMAIDNDSMQIDEVSSSTSNISTVYLSPEQIQVVKALTEQKDRLLKAITRIMKKHSKSGSKCLELLTALVKAYPNALENYLTDLVPSVSKVLMDRHATAQGKMVVLGFVSKALTQHDSKVFAPFLTAFTEMVTFAIDDPFYKISAEGLLLSAKYAQVLRECGGSDVNCNIVKLFETVNRKFIANDTDQDVRERSINSVSRILSLFKEEFAANIPSAVEKLTERVGREMTCLVAIRGFSEVVAAGISIHPDLLRSVLGNVGEYLKKMSRSLRIASLTFVQNLLNAAASGSLEIPVSEMSQVLGDLPNLLSDADLQITNQTLGCLSTAFNDIPHTIEGHLDHILDSIVKMIQSSLIQAAALNSLMNLFSSIVRSNMKNKPSFVKLLDTVTSPVYDMQNLSRQSHNAISSIASTIAETTNDLEKSQALAHKLAEQLLESRSTDSIRLFAMSTLGELGRRCPQVFVNSDIHPEQLAVEAFGSSSEELKGAAAQALGALAVGNLQLYLRFILDKIRESPKRQYLLLHALKEIIVWESSETSQKERNELFKSAIGDIWDMLIKNAGGQEDGTRSVVAECLGRLCSFDPINLLPMLEEHVDSTDPNVRSTIVSSIKYMISNDIRSADPALQRHIGKFLAKVKDDDLNVRKVALVVLNSAAHNKPALIRDLLNQLVPAVYEETQMREDLIREVQMGPFKHQVDDGLDLRKSAYECMYTLLENCADKIDANEFLTVMEVGLKDQSNDVKLLNYLTIQKIASIAPGQLFQRLDKICDPLKQQLFVKPKGNAVKQDLEKIEELKKAVIRAVFTLKMKLPDIERQQQFLDLCNTVKQNKDLQTISEAVVSESQRAVIYDIPMETV